MKNILFVDDEKILLELYSTFFNEKGDEWRAFICSDPLQVSQILKDNPIDVIVSDYNMPKMDGAKLLDNVVRNYPWVIRLIITGSADIAENLKAINHAHRCMIKPVRIHDLENEIENAYMVYKSDISRIVRTTITGVDLLPILPTLYSKLVAEVEKGDDASLSNVADMVSNDPAMSVNILKIINSPFFKKSYSISNIKHAVTMLGLNIVKYLILTAEIIKLFKVTEKNSEYLDKLITHSTNCAYLMKKIFNSEIENSGFTEEEVETAEILGLLHDIGKIMLMSLYPEIYHGIIEMSYNSEESYCEIEKKIIGVTHSEVAAYLLSLWGISSNIPKVISLFTTDYNGNDKFVKGIRFVNAMLEYKEGKFDLNSERGQILKQNSDWFKLVDSVV